LRFGAVTPPAAQRTALQINGHPNARTVVDGERVDVKDKAFHVVLSVRRAPPI